MSHSYTKIWIHGIWSTKKRLPLIDEKIEKKVYNILYDEFKDENCPCRIINGMPEHVHCLFLLNPQKAISYILGHIKGCSSHSINEKELIPLKFCWQTGFAAYSVSESQVEKVYNYIRLQKEHHKKKSFEEEFKELAELHGIPKN